MTWWTWRVQRTELLILMGVAVGVLTTLLLARGEYVWYFVTVPMTDCQTSGFSSPACLAQGSVAPVWIDLAYQLVPALMVAPVVVGGLLALPLIGELESGRVQFAWTQSKTRRQWALRRGWFLVAGASVSSLAVIALVRWWSREAIFDRASLGAGVSFDLHGVVPFGHALFGLALMPAVGVVVRRPLVTVILGAISFGAVRISFVLWIRPHLLTPITARAESETAGRGSWWLSDFWIDRSGQRFSSSEVFGSICRPSTTLAGPDDAQAFLSSCFRDHGLVQYVTYHPASRFWSFQFMEAGIFLAMAALLIGFAYWYLTRRAE